MQSGLRTYITGLGVNLNGPMLDANRFVNEVGDGINNGLRGLFNLKPIDAPPPLRSVTTAGDRLRTASGVGPALQVPAATDMPTDDATMITLESETDSAPTATGTLTVTTSAPQAEYEPAGPTGHIVPESPPLAPADAPQKPEANDDDREHAEPASTSSPATSAPDKDSADPGDSETTGNERTTSTRQPAETSTDRRVTRHETRTAPRTTRTTTGPAQQHRTTAGPPTRDSSTTSPRDTPSADRALKASTGD